jgi:hypothetical protein
MEDEQYKLYLDLDSLESMEDEEVIESEDQEEDFLVSRLEMLREVAARRSA